MGATKAVGIEGVELYCPYAPILNAAVDGELNPKQLDQYEAGLAAKPCDFTKTGICGLARVIIEAEGSKQQ